jgi:collagen type I/II/III/V/XI/XXIV/XXVII alpha
MNKTRLLTLVMALMLLLAIPTSVFAQRVPPHVFVGTVTLDGAGAADGAAVTAWVDDAQVAATTVSGGEYNLLVDQGDASFAGKTVSFKVSGANAAATATWTQGGGDELNLVATTGSADGGSGESGETGESGDKGDTGATGATGAKGDTGSAGAAGATGPGGADGASGSAGATGPAGTAGSAGVAGVAGEDGSGGLGIIALIVAIVALLAAGGSYMMGRRA